MTLFSAYQIIDGLCVLDAEQSAHCVRVLRHRSGDEIHVIDGEGTMYRCVLVNDSPKEATARIVEAFHDWGGHPYNLVMAVCPTKNIDRYEWFVEKAVELGVDRIVPVVGDHSERKTVKPERLRKIALAAAKQSLKAAVPQIDEPVSVRDFIEAEASSGALKLMAYCFEGDNLRRSICDMLGGHSDIVVMIGPEGDFSREEADLAMQAGFVPVHLGPSRLRTETAALTAVEAVYFANIGHAYVDDDSSSPQA